MPYPLDLNDPKIREFEDLGFVLFPEVLDRELVQEASDHVAWLQRKHPDLRPEQLGHTLMTHDAFWVRLISDDRLLDIAQKFIGPNIALFASHYISKPAFDGRPVLWHQDGSYWPLDPMEVVTLWLAVDDSLPENGCMRVIPGSHREALQEMKQRTDVESVLGSGIDDNQVDDSAAVNCVLKAGGVSVHHPIIIHGSNANHSPRRRCGLTIRYIPTTTRIVLKDRSDTTPERRFPSAFLLRGTAPEGVNNFNPRPAYRPDTSMKFRGCEAWV
jgi:phytanoyl-CoA hydroxylase